MLASWSRRYGCPPLASALGRAAPSTVSPVASATAQAALLFCCARPSSSSTRWKQRQGNDHFAREAKVRGLKSRAAFKLLELDAKYRLFRHGDIVVDLGYAPGSWSQVAAERTRPGGVVVGIDVIPAQPPKGVSTIQGNFLSPGVRAMVRRFVLEAARKRADEQLDTQEAGVGGGAVEGEDLEDAGAVTDRPSYIDLERQAAPPAQSEDGTKASAGGEAGGRAGMGEKSERVVDVVLSDMMMNTSGLAFRDHAGSMDLCSAALSFANDTLRPGGHFVCKFYQGAEDKLLETKLRELFAKVHREKPESSRSESKEAYFVALRRKGDVTLEDVE